MKDLQRITSGYIGGYIELRGWKNVARVKTNPTPTINITNRGQLQESIVSSSEVGNCDCISAYNEDNDFEGR